MNIYQTGQAAISVYTGEHFKNKEFVVVVEAAQEKTLKDAYIEFKNIVHQSGVRINEECEETLSVKSIEGDVYTLAHERIYSERTLKLTRRPSNLLRHMNSLDFRYENLYFDEHGSVIDLTTHAQRDIRNHTLVPQTNIKIAMYLDRNIMLKSLKLIVINNWQANADILAAFNNAGHYFSIDKTDETLKLLLKRPMAFMKFISKYNDLYDYFFRVCGLSLSIGFEEQPILKKKPYFYDSAFNAAVQEVIRDNGIPLNEDIPVFDQGLLDQVPVEQLRPEQQFIPDPRQNIQEPQADNVEDNNPGFGGMNWNGPIFIPNRRNRG